jgi:hypothetical protein
VRTRGSADPASEQTPSSRPGGYSESYAAAPAAPGNSPRSSMHCRFRRPTQDDNGSLIASKGDALRPPPRPPGLLSMDRLHTGALHICRSLAWFLSHCRLCG